MSYLSTIFEKWIKQSCQIYNLNYFKDISYGFKFCFDLNISHSRERINYFRK